jgi:hypothetical protein
MNKKHILISTSILILLASILACSVPVKTVPTATSVPDEGGSGPATTIEPTVTLTEPPELPPPAVATLRVVYIKGDNVWVWTEGTGSSQLTTAGDASTSVLSGDGQEIAFIRSGELWAINADGSNERQLVSAVFLSTLATAGNTAEVNDLVWKPGSHTIYFNSLVVAGEAGYRIPHFDLFSSNADAGADAVATQENPGSGGVPYFSPDGTVVALVQPDKIIFMEVTGAFWNVGLTFQNVLMYSEGMYVPEVVWLPDSTGLRTVIPASDPLGDPTEVTTVWNVPVSGTATVLDTFVAVPAFASAPVLSPDGSQVLYLAASGSDNVIHVRQVGGLDNDYTSAAAGQIGIVNWSPDSTHFVYWLPQLSNTYFGAVGEITSSVSDISPDANAVRWIDSSLLIYITDSGELRYRPVDGVSSLIDSNVSEYDLGWVIY